jgi:large subunit ribosomal protein L6
MSRIGRQPVNLPAGVTVQVNGAQVLVQGPKGKITLESPRGVSVKVEGSVVKVEIPADAAEMSALFGMTRARLANMVLGVEQGYQKTLLIEGTGYNAKLNGKDLELAVGFCNVVKCTPPDGIAVKCVSPTEITISGVDKEKVGQFAAEVRAARPPEPYKGKGIRYKDETIRRKAGKSVA